MKSRCYAGLRPGAFGEDEEHTALREPRLRVPHEIRGIFAVHDIVRGADHPLQEEVTGECRFHNAVGLRNDGRDQHVIDQCRMIRDKNDALLIFKTLNSSGVRFHNPQKMGQAEEKPEGRRNQAACPENRGFF